MACFSRFPRSHRGIRTGWQASRARHSRERINQLLPVVNVIPLTSRKATARVIYPNEVLLPAGLAGLRMDSIALCYQIRTLDKSRLERNLGELVDMDIRR